MPLACRSSRLRAVLFAALLGGIAAPAQAAGLAAGHYSCWAPPQPRSALNMTVLGPDTYRGDNGQSGTYARDPQNRVTFWGGNLDGVLPDGFFIVYGAHGSRPVLSFVSGRSGAEVTYCEHDG